MSAVLISSLLRDPPKLPLLLDLAAALALAAMLYAPGGAPAVTAAAVVLGRGGTLGTAAAAVGAGMLARGAASLLPAAVEGTPPISMSESVLYTSDTVTKEATLSS
jgi:hypothetical protein